MDKEIVIIIGPKGVDDIIIDDYTNDMYVRSGNGHLYSFDAIRNAAPLFEGIKVYDMTHRTPDEYTENKRLVVDLIGTIEKPEWRPGGGYLIGILAPCTSFAFDPGEAGLAIYVQANVKPRVVNGQRQDVVTEIVGVYCVDVTLTPATGGRFVRR